VPQAFSLRRDVTLEEARQLSVLYAEQTDLRVERRWFTEAQLKPPAYRDE